MLALYQRAAVGAIGALPWARCVGAGLWSLAVADLPADRAVQGGDGEAMEAGDLGYALSGSGESVQGLLGCCRLAPRHG